MAWERRRNNLYYYRVHRQGNRVIKRYFGSGEKGRDAAAEDEAKRELAKETVRQYCEQQQHLITLEEDLNEVGKLADQLLTAQLLCSGWKKHHRAWRPKYGGRDGNRASKS
jgi:hypothetical protein